MDCLASLTGSAASLDWKWIFLPMPISLLEGQYLRKNVGIFVSTNHILGGGLCIGRWAMYTIVKIGAGDSGIGGVSSKEPKIRDLRVSSAN
jgi:hypothetical protein